MDEMIRTPVVSIVVCTYNRSALLQETLASLPPLAGLDRTEILVVDNRSTDDTEDRVNRFIGQNRNITCRYIFEEVQGLSAARNAGIRAARGEIVAFLDDDAIPSPTWLVSILETFGGRPDILAMGGKIRPRFETERPKWLTGPFELPYTIVDLGNSVREYPASLHPYGANMAFRKQVFAAGMFPLELGRKGSLLLSGEESWVFGGIRRAGGTILYHPDMEVEHFVPASRLNEAWIIKRYYFQGISNGMKREGLGSTCLLLAKTAAKALYVAASSLVARDAAARLLNRCRMESVRGTLHTVMNRHAEPTAD